MQPIPTDILGRFGHLPDARHRTGNEISSACPKCGGGRGGNDPSDRFRIWERPGQASQFWCRKCLYKGFADDDKEYEPPSPAKIKEWENEAAKIAAGKKEELERRIVALAKNAHYEAWNQAMTASQREYWRRAGIPNEFQDFWSLGYVETKKFMNGDSPFTSSALSIPYFESNRTPTNIQYRLLTPPNPSDKYRFSYGLRPGLWLSEPDEKPNGRCLLLEGMKKTAVSFIELVAKDRQNLSVVGVPSKSPNLDMVAQLDDCEIVYIALDPDAYHGVKGKPSAAQRIAAMLGNRARFVRLPAKADDLFVDYGFTAGDFMRYVEGATA